MKDHNSSPEDIGTSNDLESLVLDVQGFARLARIPKATILTLRSRAPDKLPPPFRLRPLRWRTQTIVRWMEEQEQAELERIARLERGTRK
jgi:hypothetical protein